MSDCKIYDVVIIGAGVTGSAIARELSRYKLRTCVLEKEEDVCSGTSKANSAIVHAGFDAEPGSLKARFNVEGSRRMEALSKELDFEYHKNGALVLCLDEKDRYKLEALYEQGIENGVQGLRILEREELKALEPKLTSEACAALYAPESAIVCPFGLTIALAENAFDNGTEFFLDTEVLNISAPDTDPLGIEPSAQNPWGKDEGTCEDMQQANESTKDSTCKGADSKEGLYRLETSKGTFLARYVVNAAGVYADKLHNMISKKSYHITPRKGEYMLLDKSAGGHVRHTIFQLPTMMGKGVLVTPTVHGNLLVGPTATDLEDKEDTSTTDAGLSDVQRMAKLGVSEIPFSDVITSFSGLRAHEDGGDFVIGECEDAPGWFDALGIESPGLSASPAIGAYVAELVAKKAGAALKEDWDGRRKGITRLERLSEEEQAELIGREPAYGEIVCRCERISKGEILDAIHRSLGAVSMDGLKRRVRSGMGRCQGSFCTPKLLEILSAETGRDIYTITKCGTGSELLKEQGHE